MYGFSGQIHASALLLQQQYDQAATHYQAYTKRFDWCGDKLLQDSIHRLFPNKIFRKIIDVGCGTGSASESFHRASSEIIGLDVSHCMLSHARRRFADFKCLSKFDLNQSLRSSDFSTKADLLICSGALHYAKDGIHSLMMLCDEVEVRGIIAFNYIVPQNLTFGRCTTPLETAVILPALAERKMETLGHNFYKGYNQVGDKSKPVHFGQVIAIRRAS